MTDSTKYATKLTGKRILVIGGSAGIGLAVAQASAEFGATVIISSSRDSRVQEAVASILKDYPSAKGRVSGHACQLDSPDVESDIEKLFEKVGSLDHIIFTAGDKLPRVPLENVTIEVMHKVGLVRYFAAILVAKVGSKYLKKSSESSIIFTSGSIAEKPNPGGWAMLAFYASGLFGLTRQLAFDLAPIRVNTVAPGTVETGLWVDAMGEEAARKFLDHKKEEHITKHVGQPEDIAEVYLYLLRDRNVTGTTVSSNSGKLLV